MRMVSLYLLFALASSDVTRQPERLPLPLESAAHDLEGAYWVEGRFGDKTYLGTALVGRHGDLYEIQYATTAGGYSGFGLLSGGLLSIGWTQGTSRGVVAYRVLPGSVLDGRYVIHNGKGTDGKVYRETLTLLRRMPKEG